MASDSMEKVVAEMREWDYTNGNPDSHDVSGWADRLAAMGCVELRLCEVPRLILRPDQLYVFTVAPDCAECAKAAESALPAPPTKDQP